MKYAMENLIVSVFNFRCHDFLCLKFNSSMLYLSQVFSIDLKYVTWHLGENPNSWFNLNTLKSQAKIQN